MEAARANEALAATAEAIFSSGQYARFKLREGRIVNVTMARVKHTAAITKFMQSLMHALSEGEAAQLFTIITRAQEDAIKMANGDPKQVSIELIVAAALGVQPDNPAENFKAVVTRFADIGGVLCTLLGAVTVEVGKLASIFTDIPEADFQELPIDEGALVIAAVFMANYHFFTQTLRPIYRGFFRAWMAAR